MCKNTQQYEFLEMQFCSVIDEKDFERIKNSILEVKSEINEMKQLFEKYNKLKDDVEKELGFNQNIEMIIDSNELSLLTMEVKEFISNASRVDEEIINQLTNYKNNLQITKRNYKSKIYNSVNNSLTELQNLIYIYPFYPNKNIVDLTAIYDNKDLDYYISRYEKTKEYLNDIRVYIFT